MFSFWTLLATGSMGAVAELTLDPQLKYWVLLPISIVMVLTGILRQYITVLIGPKLKTEPRVKLTESQYIIKAQALLGNGSNLSTESFEIRKDYLVKILSEGKYVAKANQSQEGQVPNPFTDPNMSESMMAMAKGNLANFIPQTLIMWWVNHFFAGFVLMKLPFPLTLRFKEMLQSGIMTSDLDVRWVSSISWYFISVVGLNPVYNLLLAENAQDQLGMLQQQGQLDPMMGAPGGPQPADVMKGLANDMTIVQHQSCLDNIESRILKMYAK
ncbi:ER membrane complex subunit EMC3 NDAI_0D01520 [Naumovozyma dairenensis CBS 421]|uniref:ER membrane protein complex subunit 3 n=1 Tax=Naumovozyma dairenensis (strain ATCC 10597 / BCRC 20456 / CBS 421 / NBRC 0211 / NRRL Y-12639) TaxID=1071378 RepID=G0W9K5_NAUDC|nr:hypothetical protein NDAI_0D01520 [Naumovozyma dairenensis CBS 421]CCD24466.1 hypothetical protein NDAI_0D01520 [Naumovozyma dairenensis CBS 421]